MDFLTLSLQGLWRKVTSTQWWLGEINIDTFYGDFTLAGPFQQPAGEF
jgi:hypothetical protein